MTDCKASAMAMLDAVDTFMSGATLSNEQMELQKSVTRAGAFAAAAYDAHSPMSGGEYHAMTRAFLLGLIDPLHPELDYLRSDPKSGEVARLASADLSTIVADGEGKN